MLQEQSLKKHAESIKNVTGFTEFVGLILFDYVVEDLRRYLSPNGSTALVL